MQLWLEFSRTLRPKLSVPQLSAEEQAESMRLFYTQVLSVLQILVMLAAVFCKTLKR